MSLNTDNLTAVLYGIDDLRLEQRPIPKPTENQVLIGIETVGICGSDVHYWVRGRIGPFILKKPMVIGHEASGTIVEVGSKVENLKCGDRIAIEPGVPCRYCEYCKKGQYNLCAKMRFCATPPYNGNLTRYYVHDADFCHKLPDNVSLDEGALIEPLSVGVHACKRAQVTFGTVCVVLGAGPIGLLTTMAAKAMGSTTVLITDILENRLSTAKGIGADHILNMNNLKENEIVEKIRELLNGREPDVTFDCAGFEICTRVALKVTKNGGVVILVGMGAEEVKVPLVGALIREVDLKGIFRYCNDYPTAIEMVSSGKIGLKPLITHHFPIEKTERAFETAKLQIGFPTGMETVWNFKGHLVDGEDSVIPKIPNNKFVILK